MFKRIYSNTFEAIFRNAATRVFLIILLATILFECIMQYAGTFLSDGSDFYYNIQGYYKYIFNVVNAFVTGFLSFIIILICCYDMNYDNNNGFYDISKVTRMKTGSYYFAKLLAYFTFFYTVVIITVILELITTLLSPNFHMQLNFADFLPRIGLNMIIIAIPAIVTYISISVFFTVLTKKTSVGIICSLIYYFLGSMTGYNNLFRNFIYWIPNKLNYYIYYWRSIFMEDFINSEQFKTSLGEAALSLAIVLSIDVILLAAGYFILSKKRLTYAAADK